MHTALYHVEEISPEEGQVDTIKNREWLKGEVMVYKRVRSRWEWGGRS